MDAAHTLQMRTKTVLQKIVEVRPMACDKGSSAKGPTTMPARAIDVYSERNQQGKRSNLIDYLDQGYLHHKKFG